MLQVGVMTRLFLIVLLAQKTEEAGLDSFFVTFFALIQDFYTEATVKSD